MLRSRQIALFVVCAVLVVLSVPAGRCMGATRTWTGTSDDDWFNTANWDLTGDPDRADVLYVYSGSPTTTSNVTTDYGGSITVSGSSARASFGSLYAGEESAGSLYILSGGTASSTQGCIGRGSSASGAVTVSGAGSTWDNNGDMFVGLYGPGTIDIAGGGAVINGIAYVGYVIGAPGAVTVDGAGSTWTSNGPLFIGRQGTGSLGITGSGDVSNDSCYIGMYSGYEGAVTVDGAGSTWTTNGYLRVGYEGTGSVDIINGGNVSNTTYSYIGQKSGSTGSITIEGADSAWTNSGSMYVGGESTNAGGTGSVTVRDGGYLEVGGTLRVWNTGALDIGGAGRITVSKRLSLAQDSTLTAEGGAVIHMTGSAFQNESTNSANLAGLGNLTLIFEGGTGDVDPFEVAGEDVGAVIGGFVGSNFVLGALQIGGTDVGRIQLVDDFDNQDDGSLGNEALYVESLTIDSGSCVDLNGLNLYFKKDGNAKKLYQGDANVDGQVDDSDLSLLLSNWNQSGGWPEGDFNCDGAVIDADLSLLLSNWGAGIGGSVSSVPEPAALTLFALGALAVLKRRRRPRA